MKVQLSLIAQKLKILNDMLRPPNLHETNINAIRDAEIITSIMKGESFRIIGKKFGISTARVGQIARTQIDRIERWKRDSKARLLFKQFRNAKILQNLQVITHAMTNIIEPYVERKNETED